MRSRVQAGFDLGGHHGTAEVGHQGARQAAFLKGLGEAVNQALGGFVQIPLQVAAKARAVIEHPEEQRRDPGARGAEHRARTMMKIKMPQTVDVVGFEAALRTSSRSRRSAAASAPAL